MHFQRATFPSAEICQHLALSLDVLARHMELQPHLFRVQLDHAAVLSRTTVEALRDDFIQASRAGDAQATPDVYFDNERQLTYTPFFFEEERQTFFTALCALEEYRDNLGDWMVLEEMQRRLNLAGATMLNADTGSRLTQVVTLLPAIPAASPHRGQEYQHRHLPSSKPGYPDGHDRYRIVEEINGEDVVLDSFADLTKAEAGLCAALNHEHDAYLMDAEEDLNIDGQRKTYEPSSATPQI